MGIGKIVSIWALSLLTFLSITAAKAQTVDDIVQRKKITIGVISDLPPFGFVNASGDLDGYEAGVAKLLAKSIGVEAELVPVTGPNRIPYLLTGRVDAIVATLAVTTERAKQVMYSTPYADQDVSLYAPVNSKISKVEDTAGLRIAATRGNVEEQLLHERFTSAQPLLFDDDASTHQALLSGQADAVLSNSKTFANFAKGAAAGYEQKILLNRDVQGIAVRKGSFELLQYINTFIGVSKMNGSLDELHRKYFGIPLPKDLPVY